MEICGALRTQGERPALAGRGRESEPGGWCPWGQRRGSFPDGEGVASSGAGLGGRQRHMKEEWKTVMSGEVVGGKSRGDCR